MLIIYDFIQYYDFLYFTIYNDSAISNVYTMPIERKAMFANPFSPLFGGRPDFFFGRQRILDSFERAFEARGSDYRTLFVTGARGFGKTALLEQLSIQATQHEWDVIDVNAENALQSLFRRLSRFDDITATIDPRLEVKVLGSGGSLGGKSTSKTTHYTTDDLDVLLIEACEKAQRGVLVTIDEVQKIPLDDVSRICGAFQMASRKGHEIMLAVAGLPFAHREISQHDGCTYMRRAVHEELGLFMPDEVRTAFVSAFKRIKGLSVDGAALDTLVANSSGHPYMIQLLGYNVVELANDRTTSNRYTATANDANDATREALSTYEQRSLAPILDALGPQALRYLEAMCDCLDDNLEAETRLIAEAFGKEPKQLTYYRDQLVRNGIILPTEHGKVRFGIPFLRQYLRKAKPQSENARLIAEWQV